MLTVTRSVKTYTSCTEHWTDGRLYIEYSGEREYSLRYDGERFLSPDCADEELSLYLRSAAEFEYAAERCRDIAEIGEYVADIKKLLPEELLRLLLDDCGLPMRSAADIVLRYFGTALRGLSGHEFLKNIQPRTFALNAALSYELRLRCFHDPADAFFRSPYGAVTAGTEISFSALGFGALSAELKMEADGVSESIPMTERDGVFSCRFCPTVCGAYSYGFSLDGGEPFGEFRLTVYEKDFRTPAWFRRGVMYQIFPDRFGFGDRDTFMRGMEYHRSLGRTPEAHGSISEPVKWQPHENEKDYRPNDFYGGNLRGIAGKLPYLKGLGVTVIYLNPIFEASSNNRYDTADYEKIDPILGTNEDFSELCKKASELGIKIICDGVFSHTGADSVYFDRYGHYGGGGAYQRKDSPYYKWYDFRGYPDDYRSWWGFRDLPEVNETDPDWQEYIIKGENSIVKSWLRAGASGWRLDVADELPDEVLCEIRAAAKAEKPDCVIIGEVWEDAVTKESYGVKRRYALGAALDSVMNYPLRRAVIDFATGEISSFKLRELLLSQRMNYPKPMYLSLMNLLGSHDVERLHSALATGLELRHMPREEQIKVNITKEQSERATKLQMLCAAIQYTLPGVPCLYYGDEESLDGGGDPFCRQSFEPTGNGLHNFYAELAELRLGHESLLSGELEIKTPTDRSIVIERYTDTERTVCVINASDGVLISPEAFDGTVPPLSYTIVSSEGKKA